MLVAKVTTGLLRPLLVAADGAFLFPADMFRQRLTKNHSHQNLMGC